MPSLKDHLYLRTRSDKEEERKVLGFLRQPRVRWLSPPLLAKTGVDVGVSATFGKLADKRELETVPQGAFDYSSREELWLDFLSDTGDGWEATCTMAWLLARESLACGDLSLPRGEVLLLGGDQVYPAPGEDGVAYEDRFLGPFSAAGTGADSPDLFALPGNHDWYDGLTSFLRIFCPPAFLIGGGDEAKTIGDWRPQQRRSYWALRLPHDWWIWAIDIQFDTFIDSAQLEYFHHVADTLEGQRVILITAKPSWVKAEPDRVAPASWRNLAYFERKMIAERGGELALTLSGDLHHYSRYEPTQDGADPARINPTRITAGGGGAYLSATHTLPATVHLVHEQGKTAVPYERAEIYPDEKTSKRLSWWILGVAWHNPGFAGLMAAAYALLGLASTATDTTIAAAVPLALILGVYADFPKRLVKALVGSLHAAVHLAVAAGIVSGFDALLGDAGSGWLWSATIAAELLFGFLLGSTLFAAYLLLVHRARGDKAPKHTNEVFAGQGIRDHKNFLRLHLDRDGKLTVYPLGVERVCARWDLEQDGIRPRFSPHDEAPQVEPADKPLHFPSR